MRAIPMMREMLNSGVETNLRRMARMLCRALVAAGRTEAALALAHEARTLDPSRFMADALRFMEVA